MSQVHSAVTIDYQLDSYGHMLQEVSPVVIFARGIYNVETGRGELIEVQNERPELKLVIVISLKAKEHKNSRDDSREIKGEVSKENDSSDNEKDQKRRPRPEVRPEPLVSVMKVLTLIGRDGGLLQRVLRSLDKRFQIQDKELATKFEEY